MRFFNAGLPYQNEDRLFWKRRNSLWSMRERANIAGVRFFLSFIRPFYWRSCPNGYFISHLCLAAGHRPTGLLYQNCC